MPPITWAVVRQSWRELLVLVLLSMWLASVDMAAEPIVCHAGTEVDITAKGEYPVWAIECDGGRKVVIVD